MHASRRHITGGCSASFAIRRPGLAWDGGADREHARQPIEIAIKLFGIAPASCAGPRARASAVHRDPWPELVAARGVRRPPNPTLQLSSAPSIAVERLDTLANGQHLSGWSLGRLQLSSALGRAPDYT